MLPRFDATIQKSLEACERHGDDAYASPVTYWQRWFLLAFALPHHAWFSVDEKAEERALGALSIRDQRAKEKS